MAAFRRVRAIFTGATPVAPLDGDPDGGGVWLHFRPERTRLEVDRIDAFAALGPTLDLPEVSGLGKVLRVLRAGRVAAPADGEELLGQQDAAAALLARAVGTDLVLELKPRSRLRFTAWTETGIEMVDDVSEVLESSDAYLILRSRGRAPVRVAREHVVRQRTECERWYEVMAIERA